MSPEFRAVVNPPYVKKEMKVTSNVLEDIFNYIPRNLLKTYISYQLCLRGLESLLPSIDGYFHSIFLLLVYETVILFLNANKYKDKNDCKYTAYINLVDITK